MQNKKFFNIRNYSFKTTGIKLYLERAHKCFVNTHHASRVIKFSTIVGCGEKSHQLAFGEEFVTIFNDLMSPTDQIKIVPIQEFADNIRAEGEGNTTVIFRPSLDILVWVGPK